jgi:hypothetical protein
MPRSFGPSLLILQDDFGSQIAASPERSTGNQSSQLFNVLCVRFASVAEGDKNAERELQPYGFVHRRSVRYVVSLLDSSKHQGWIVDGCGWKAVRRISEIVDVIPCLQSPRGGNSGMPEGERGWTSVAPAAFAAGDRKGPLHELLSRQGRYWNISKA